jgi:hypothetical protein
MVTCKNIKVCEMILYTSIRHKRTEYLKTDFCLNHLMDLTVIRLLRYLNLIINYRGCRKCKVTDDSWTMFDYT